MCIRDRTALGPTGTVTQSEVTFVWTNASDSVRYQILVLDLNNQENVVLDATSFNVSSNGQTASYSVNLEDGTYRFWVRAFNSQGTASGWSNSLSFIVEDRLTTLNETNEGDDGELVSFEYVAQQATEAPELPADYLVAEATSNEQPVAAADVDSPADSGDADADQLAQLMARLADPQTGLLIEES